MLELNKVHLGDCIHLLKLMDDNSIDSIVTDPPYELGFMGKSWDNTGIANNVDLWRECLRVLKPGGHLLSFSGTRTYHRMASAIEDAGFEVRDMIERCYGSGFPKSLNIGKAINKIDGVEFESKPAEGVGFMNNDTEDGYHPTINQLVQKGESSDRAKQWEGWGTALKPAHEPICMARKPLAEKTVALNVLKYRTGGINIDESRVGTEEKLGRQASSTTMFGNGNMTKNDVIDNSNDAGGRFPANLLHDNSEEVRECFPNESERFFKSIIYQAKASKSEKKLEDGSYSTHPTVKPIALMEYLIKMVTPKGGTVLDPFTGSGSTLVAAKKNGYQYIGCELTDEYIPITEARLNATEFIDEEIIPQHSLF